MSSEQKTDRAAKETTTIEPHMLNASPDQVFYTPNGSTNTKDKDAPVSHLPQDADKETASLFPCLGTPEEEASDERAWAEQFANSADFLSQLVSEAGEERRQGKLVPLETIFDE